MGPTQVFCSTYGKVLTVAAAVVSVLAIVLVSVADGAGDALRFGLGAVSVTYAIWLAYWAPRIEVSDGGIDVVNVTRSFHVPWPAFRAAHVRWSLEVETTTRTITAWAAPRSSATRLRAGRPSRSGAEAASEAIAARHEALAEAGYLRRSGERDQPPTTATWNRWQLVVGLVLAAATIASWTL